MTRRISKRKKSHKGGSPKLPLNPSPVDGTNIEFLNPSPLLNRSIPYTPPRPESPSPPPPLGITSGPAYGLKINGPPLLAGGKKHKKSKKNRKSVSFFGDKKFKKHYMWNNKGKKYYAKTYKQHLEGLLKGHTHKKPKKR